MNPTAVTSKSRVATLLIPLLISALAVAALSVAWESKLNARRNIISLATLQLRSAIVASRPYSIEFGYFEELAGDRAELQPATAVLAKNAADGMPSLGQLLVDFKTAAATSLIAEQDNPSLGFMNGLTSRVAATAVAISMEAGANPFRSTVTPAIAEAEMALRSGDVGKAMETVSALPPELSAPFAVWTVKAKERIDVENAMQDLCDRLVGRSAARG